MADVHLPHAAPDGHRDVHHETSDVNIRGIFVFAGALLVTGVLIHLLVWVLFRYFTARETVRVPRQYPLATAQENRLPPEPRLQTNPRQDLRDLRAHEDDILNSYGWVDRNAGIVRIPIDQAMKLTLQRGLPSRRQVGETR